MVYLRKGMGLYIITIIQRDQTDLDLNQGSFCANPALHIVFLAVFVLAATQNSK
jgi:hypothetical protein